MKKLKRIPRYSHTFEPREVRPKPYNPHANNKIILAKAFEMLQEVPYRVSLRWLFYRLLQFGYYDKKSDYKEKWTTLSSNARKRYYKDWEPETLADETRYPIIQVSCIRDIEHCIRNIPNLADELVFDVDHFYRQDYYLEIWYEARAMTEQFRHYSHDGINLRPFGGHPSVPYKFEIANELEYYSGLYNKPIQILYFGDYDKGGTHIYKGAMADIALWYPGLEVEWCGLTREQVIEHELPEKPKERDKPRGYQWEALDDEAAGKIIQTSIEKYLDTSLIKEVREETKDERAEWVETIRDSLEELVAEHG